MWRSQWKSKSRHFVQGKIWKGKDRLFRKSLSEQAGNYLQKYKVKYSHSKLIPDRLRFKCKIKKLK